MKIRRSLLLVCSITILIVAYHVNIIKIPWLEIPIPNTPNSNFIFGILAMGEGWHNNHHAFPRSAFHGMRWWQIDPSAWLIWTMEKLGLAREVVRISEDRKAKRRKHGVGTTEGDLLPGLELTPQAASAVNSVTSVVEAVTQVTSATPLA